MGRHVAALLLLLLACCSWAKLYRRSHHNHLDDWLTSEQKKEIKELDTGDNHEAVRDKIIEFYNQLDEDVRKSWDGKYKEKCAAWMKNVASEEELLELKALFESGQAETWQTKVKEYKQRLGETARSKVDLWENECRRLWNLPSRARRSGPNDDAAFKEFTSWTTAEQQAVLNELKNGGADHATIKAKVLEYFKALPEDQQKKVSGEFKDKCRLYFVKLANPDEIENLKKLHADNKLEEAKQIILNVIERQGDDVKPVAKKYQQVCEEVYEHKSKARRDINTLIDKHFSWMSPQQKEEVRKMQADGKSQAEMRDRIFQFLKESPSADKIRNDTRDSCYRWLKEVASPAEIDALHELHKTDHGACKTKVREYLARLPTNRQTEVEKSLPACEKIWYGDHGHDHHGHHHVKRDLSDGDEALLANIYKAFGFRKAVANEEHHELCRLKIRDLFGRTRERELKKLRDEEDWTPVELQQRIDEWIEEIEDPEERTRTQIALTHCKTFLGARRHRRDQNSKLEEALKGPHLSWLTDAQKAELKGLGTDRKAVFAKIGEYYDALSGEAKEKATEAGKGACRALVKDVFGEEKANELKALKESGTADADLEAKLKGWTDALEDPEKKETVALAGPGCKKVFSVASRKRRDNTKLEEALKGPHLAWLTDAQKAELKGLGADRKAVFAKIGEYYDALTGEAKEKATEAGKGACRALVKDVFGEEKATELKTLKESGAADADIEAKLKGWTDALTDPEKKETVAFAGPGCKKVFSVSSRRRRDLAKLEEAFKSHLSWTNDEQKAELRKLANDRRALFAKTQQYYEALTGDAKDKATELFKGACRHFVKDVFGEEKANELKALKEAGSSAADIEAKVKEWTDALTDPAKKETVELAGPGCKKLLAPASRKRRDHHNEKLAEALKTHLSWLTDDQKEALKGLGHDRKAIFDKVNEFLDALTGEAKEKAVESLKGGCRALIKDIFGDEKAAELKALKESGATDQIEAKITEWTNALDDPAKKETVEFAGPGCKKLFKPARRFRRDQDTKDIKGRLSHALETHLAWLTPEQKESLKEFKGDKQLIYKKILEYYDTTTGETREKATEALQGGCRHYIKEILGDEKANEIKTLKESGATKEQLVSKVEGYISELADGEKKERAQNALAGCKKVFGVSRKRRDHHEGHDTKDVKDRLSHALETHLKWLNEEQVKTVKELAGDKQKIFEKVLEWYDATSGDKRTEATEALKEGCRCIIKDVLGEEKANEIKALKEAGEPLELLAKKIDEWILALGDVKERKKAQEAVYVCKTAYGVKALTSSRKRRTADQQLEEALNTHLAWLSDKQKTELRAMTNRVKVVLTIYRARKNITEEGRKVERAACLNLLKKLFGETEFAILKDLTGTPLKDKLKTLIDNANDVQRKRAMRDSEYSGGHCDSVFEATMLYASAHRPAPNTQNVWLTREQLDILKNLKQYEALDKLVEFYEGLTGEKRERALESLRAECFSIVRQLFGHDRTAEFKVLKEAGSTQAELSAKIDEWIEGIADADKKADAKRASGGCKKIFGVGASRRRRSHLDDAFTTHLKWLSDEQKTALRSIESDKKAIYDKVLEFYDATTGEKRSEATEALKGGCRAAVKELFGEEKANELKALKESGVSHDEIGAKVATWIEALDDPVKKERAQNTVTGCKRVFAAASRKRRAHHDKLTDLVKSHTSWLTDEQKAELQGLGDDRKAVFAKIEEFYDALTGDPHEKAKEELKNGCRLLIKDIFGEEKAAELKALKEAGQAAEIEPKITEWSAAITDSQKKETFGIARRGCSKLFDYPKRKRRDHHNEKLAEALKTHLSWLTDDQKEALKGLGHDRKAIFDKVNEFLDALTGDAKEKAVESLKGGCRALIKDVFGDEKAAELKTLKESGAGDQIEAKITEWTNALDDPAKKETVEFAGPGCKKLFKPARFRRDESDESEEEQLERFRRDPSGKDSKDIKGRLAHALETHLAWLTAEQKESLKEFKGDKQLIYKKIMEFYETTTGETREKATESLQAGCRQYIKEILGEEKANEIKALKESGATNQQLVEKIESYVNAIGDAEKKERAQNALAGCKKVFGVTRKRRHHHRHFHKKREISAKLAEALKTHLSWLNDDQKEVLKGLGEDRKAIFAKVQEFYDSLSGDAKDKATESIKNGCRGLVKDVFGEEKANELKTLKESGAADADIEAKVKAWSDALEDPAKKETVALAGPGCKKVFSTASRKRRDEDSQKKLAEALKTHLSWLSDDQKEVLKGLGTDRKAIFAKVQEFYDALTGDAKEKATEALKNGCRGLIKDIFGEEKANELKALKESGAAEADIEAKVKAWTDALEDPKKKETVSIVGPGCKKIFSPASRKRRDEDSQKKLAEALKTHLSWLNDDQKEVLKELGTDRKAIFAKVQEFYDSLSGDAKDKATESIKNGCRGLLKDVFGEEKANELKALKESGAAVADIEAKVKAWTDALEDAGKKETVALAGPGCKKVFGAASRKRRGEDYLTEALKTHLSWLTDEQKDAVKDLGSDRKALYTKVMDFYAKTEGETRTKATESLQDGCRKYIKALLGDDKAEEVKSLKESGASKEAIAAKIEGYIQEIEDPAKKERAQTALVGCKKLFGVGGSRKRRDEKDRLGEALKTHLAWLSDDQKEALKGLGNPKEIYKKVLEFYDATTGETREKATEALQGGCRHYIKEILGDEKAEEIKALKESGATKEQISDKIESFIGALDEGEKKERAQNALVGCKKVYGVSRMRRHGRAGRHRRGVTTFNEVLIANKAWMTQEEFTAINRARQEETEVSELVDQLEDIYEKTSGDRRTRASSRMRAVCHTALTEELGEKTLRTLDQLTRRAAVGSEMSEEVRNLFEEVGDAAGDLKKFQFICTEAYKDYHIPNANDK